MNPIVGTLLLIVSVLAFAILLIKAIKKFVNKGKEDSNTAPVAELENVTKPDKSKEEKEAEKERKRQEKEARERQKEKEKKEKEEKKELERKAKGEQKGKTSVFNWGKKNDGTVEVKDNTQTAATPTVQHINQHLDQSKHISKTYKHTFNVKNTIHTTETAKKVLEDFANLQHATFSFIK